MIEEAKSYQGVRDFAFFVVNFNYSKAEYNQLTELEKAFIYKAYEDKVVNESTFARNAHLNAIVNSKRKKNKKFIDLFKKSRKKVDKEFNQNAESIIKQTEENEGKSWVDKIYSMSGQKRPTKKGGR
ncbi:hypothetical protein [Alkalihalobacillus trypoxylicola]|uniref:Phenylalanine racemase n=1 Tax=Alkalihalobacillus trypoxylicola TaxID=519424 RepID=A0A162F6M2_9BACI|nr:hypothetical protein [Alkalihalobacillus trypoxylicola]KYG34908.1 phenylalanine racemase [Alkalihalobacillus trypoxylicola]